jgi:hypothetical protein
MLDADVHQACGLWGLASPTVPRLVAVVSHGQRQVELPMLWSLCSAWDSMGLSVLVLDGMTPETNDNPGLLQLLNNPHLHFDQDNFSELWGVMPATLGLEFLSTHPTTCDMLGHIFGHYGVVLIYSHAALLPQMFRGTDLSPLVLLTPQTSSFVSAYRVIKHLLLYERLRPTVANIALMSNVDTVMNSSLHHLQHCTQTFLGFHPDALTIRAARKDGRTEDDIQRLALQLLENSVELHDDDAEVLH